MQMQMHIAHPYDKQLSRTHAFMHAYQTLRAIKMRIIYGNRSGPKKNEMCIFSKMNHFV